jgi:hypothetical protein
VIQKRMIAPDGVHEVYGLVYHVLLGPDSSTSLLIDECALGLCGEELRRQLPWVRQIPCRPGADFEHVSVRDWAWLDRWEGRVGPRHLVRTMEMPLRRPDL